MKSPRSAFSRAILLALCTAVFTRTPLALAQDSSTAPADEISCSSNFGNPVELPKEQLHFISPSQEEIASIRKSQPDLTAGPFSGGKFAYEQVDIYLVNTKDETEDSSEGSVSLYARAVQSQKESWFKIVAGKDDVGFDFFSRNIGDAGPGSYENSPSGASLAVKKFNIPIFEIVWWKHESGANTFAEVRKVLLLDFRNSPPQMMAALQCVSAEGGGACGVYDNGAAPTTTLACNWDGTKSDFLCTSTASGDYTVPVATRFYLTNHTPAPYAAKGGGPPTLELLGSWSTIDPSWHTKGADIPGLGHVTYLGDYSSPSIRGTAVLFAARGRDSNEARFFAVIVDPQGPTLALEIHPQPLIDEPPPIPMSTDAVLSAPDLQAPVVQAAIHPEERFADDVWPSFHVRPLEKLPAVSAWQVTVTQGTAHGVVWLAAGRNPTTERFVFSAVRIATEIGTYAHCGSGRSKAFAAATRRKRGSLDVLLDVEPSHEFDLEGKLADGADEGQPAAFCTVPIKLSWNNSLGFVREQSDPDCPEDGHARVLSISDQGVITAKPGDLSSPN